MSDYTPTTDFSPKDALNAGEANKLVKGSELDTEYNAIQTAVGTKYDSSDLATQAAAEAGADNTTLITPLRVQQWGDNQGILSQVTKHKTADESVTSSTTLQDDNHLAGWTLVAASYYHVEGVLRVVSDTTPDIKFLFDTDNNPQLISVQFVEMFGDDGGTQNDSSTAIAVPIPGATAVVVLINGVIFTHASSSATLNLQFAQNTSNGTAATLKKGSYIRVRKIA